MRNLRYGSEYLKNLCRSHCFLFSITPFLSPIFLFQITILKTMGNTGNVMESHFSSQFLTIFTVFCFVLFVFCHNLLHIGYMLHYGALTCKIRLTITSNTLSKKKKMNINQLKIWPKRIICFYKESSKNGRSNEVKNSY